MLTVTCQQAPGLIKPEDFTIEIESAVGANFVIPARVGSSTVLIRIYEF